MASVADTIKKICKEYKDNNLFTKANVFPEYKKLACHAFGMDYPLYGGLPYGRICVYSGLQHSGKTTAACCELGAYQRENPDKVSVYFDVEHSLDLQFQARMNGLDLDRIYIPNINGLSGEQICDMILDLQQSDDIGMIILDSIPALIPQIVMENDLTKDAGMRGTIAKTLHRFLPLMSTLVADKGNIFILINQVRIVGKTYNGANIYAEPGGSAPQYYSSVSVRFGSRKFTKGEDMDACKGDGEGADGFRLGFKITKNKCAPCARGGGFITYRYATGLDWLHDVLEIALTFDFIKRLNNVTYELVNLETGEVYVDADTNAPLHGKKADLVDYIYSHPAFQSEYLNMLTKHISDQSVSYGKVLDARIEAEIDTQEDAVSGAKDD